MKRALASLAIAACVTLPPGGAGAQTGSGFDIAGRYELIRPAQPTETPGKVEVVDIFWYGCPHCFSLLPAMEQYEKTKPDYVEIRRMPAIFRKSWLNHARAYYTARALGVDERIHRPLFEAIHVAGRRLDTRTALRAFFESHGVAGQDFDAMWDSFAVESGVNKSGVMQGRYGITGTPTVVVNGKYRVTGSLAGSYESMVKVIAALADKERNATQAAQ